MTGRRWLIAGLMLVVALPVIALGGIWLALRTDSARSWVESAISSRVGEKVEIGGPLTLDMSDLASGTLNFRAEDIAVGERARIGLVNGVVRIWPLFRGELSMESLMVERPQIALALSPDNAAAEPAPAGHPPSPGNPPAGEAPASAPPASEPEAPAGDLTLPVIDRILVTDGLLHPGSADARRQHQIKLAKLEGRITPQSIQINATGELSKSGPANQGGEQAGNPEKTESEPAEPATTEPEGTEPERTEQVALDLNLSADQGKPWPVKGKLVIGSTEASIDGTAVDPFGLRGFDVGFSLTGQDLLDLGGLLGWALPRSRDYRMTARLKDHDKGWQFADIEGLVGESDVAGTLDLDLSRPQTRLTGELSSRKLAAIDLTGLVGVSPRGTDDYPTRGRGRVLPATPVDIEGLRAVDADITIRAERVEAPFSPFDQMEGRILLDAGKLQIEPLLIGVGGGQLTGRLQLDGSGETAELDTDLRLRSIKMARLFRETPFARDMGGTINGAIQLKGGGPTLADMLAKANGKAGFAVAGGRVTSLAVKGLKTNILETLGVVLTGSEPLPFNCLVADMSVRNGVGRVQALVLDTPETLVTGNGTVNLDTEKLALRVVGDAKEFQVFATHVPVVIGGSLGAPALELEAGETAARGAAAVALGALLTPLAALIPLLDTGTEETVSCRALVQRARGR